MFKVLGRKCYSGAVRNVLMLPWDLFRYNWHSRLARNGNGGENAKLVNPGLSSSHFRNVTIGFSKKGLIKGYSIVPRHKLSLQPSRTFFSSWSIWHQAIKRLVLLLCRQRSVKWKREISVKIMSIIITQCLKTSLRAVKSVKSLKLFVKQKQYCWSGGVFFLARLLRMNK